MGTVHAKSADRDNTPPHPMSHLPHTEYKRVDFASVQARVDRIKVSGLGRTKDDIIVDQLNQLFKARNFEQVVLTAREVRGKLQGLGCFKNVGILIDVSSGKDASANGVEVTFVVKELKRVVGGINTLVGDNEGSLVLGLSLPNTLGRGEKLHTEYSYSSRKTSGFHISTVKPLRGKTSTILSGSVYQQDYEWAPSGFKQTDHGILMDIGFKLFPHVQHNLQWEGVWRELASLSRTTSFDVRQQSGHTLKSAIRHVLCVDTRDGSIFPNDGSLLRIISEIAGFGGDVGFFKNEVQLQTNLALPLHMVIQGAVHGGLLTSFDPSKRHVICDNYFLGGPLNLRGFEARGVGPHKDGDSVGATAYWASALHLYTPLPFKPGKGGFGELFRTHLFVNAGNIGDWQFTRNMSANKRELIDKLRVVYGFGIAVRMGQVARLELNYCIPLMTQKGDRVSPGIQLGVGVSFL